jgi:hypothetical protein
MRIVGLLGCVLVLGGVSACAVGGPPRADETDRIAGIVALAIDFPRQDDAVGYARAAVATRAGQDGLLSVVGVSERRIVLRVHLQAYDDDTSFSFDRHEPEVFACYDLEVGVSGVSRPARRPCPPTATPVALPPPPPVMEIPVGADAVVRSVLRRTSTDDIEASLRRALPSPGAHALPPDVRVGSRDGGVGVALRGHGTCLLGLRADSKVLVWHLSPTQAAPGELSCDPATALGRQGIHPPH